MPLHFLFSRPGALLTYATLAGVTTPVSPVYCKEPVPVVSSVRRTYSFNQNWEFFRIDPKPGVPAPGPAGDDPPAPPTDAVWESVNLPHTARLEPLDAGNGRNFQGVCWYRKTLTPDAAWAGKKILLRFEGAMQVADVWLDGKKLTTHFGGYQPFVLDLTDRLTPGRPAALVIRLDNSDNPQVPPGTPQNRLDFTYFSGMYRDVGLTVADRLHITDEILADTVGGGGVFVTYPEVSKESATVEVRVQVKNDRPSAATASIRCSLSAHLVTSSEPALLSPGETRTFTVRIKVSSPKLWHPEHPDLYNLRTELVVEGGIVDDRATRIGIRRLEFRPAGLFINGEKFFAQGFNRHQDHPYVGYAVSDAQQYRDAKKMRDAGLTSFRSHYPQSPAFMDACDELGILCVVSNAGWQFAGDKVWRERFVRNAHEMVRRDRNHPSAVIWEPFPNETGISEAFGRELNDAVHAEYPGDQAFVAGDQACIAGYRKGDGPKYTDIDWSREIVEGMPFWGREWGDSIDDWGNQQGRVRVARGWGEAPLVTQAVNHAIKLDTMLKRAGGGPAATKLAGAGVWAGIDCYRGYHHQPFLGGSLDLFRLPKFDYYFFQSQRDPAAKVPGVDSGPMVFIANYGTLHSSADVTVFSNCEEVRFHENGRLVATQKPESGYVLDHPPFFFKAKAEHAAKSEYRLPVDLAANSEYDYGAHTTHYKAEGLIGGKVVATHDVRSPGVMSKILLAVDYSGKPLTADGADWIRVYAKVCDGNGTVHPFANDRVTLSVEGEGAVINDASIDANPVRAEAGIATFLVRATKVPGKIILRATSPDLTGADAVIESLPSREEQR